MSFENFMAYTRAFISDRECQSDRRWLLELIAGRVDLASLNIFPRMEPMFAKYDANPAMKALLERAAIHYANNALAAAAWLIAGSTIENARRIAKDD